MAKSVQSVSSSFGKDSPITTLWKSWTRFSHTFARHECNPIHRLIGTSMNISTTWILPTEQITLLSVITGDSMSYSIVHTLAYCTLQSSWEPIARNAIRNTETSTMGSQRHQDTDPVSFQTHLWFLKNIVHSGRELCLQPTFLQVSTRFLWTNWSGMPINSDSSDLPVVDNCIWAPTRDRVTIASPWQFSRNAPCHVEIWEHGRYKQLAFIAFYSWLFARGCSQSDHCLIWREIFLVGGLCTVLVGVSIKISKAVSVQFATVTGEELNRPQWATKTIRFSHHSLQIRNPTPVHITITTPSRISTLLGTL